MLNYVTSHTTLNIVDCPHKPTQVFSTCFSHSNAFAKLPISSPIPKFLQVTLNCGVIMKWATKKKMQLDFGSPFHKNSTLKRVWLGAILIWVVFQKVFQKPYKWGQNTLKKFVLVLYGHLRMLKVFWMLQIMHEVL